MRGPPIYQFCLCLARFPCREPKGKQEDAKHITEGMEDADQNTFLDPAMDTYHDAHAANDDEYDVLADELVVDQRAAYHADEYVKPELRPVAEQQAGKGNDECDQPIQSVKDKGHQHFRAEHAAHDAVEIEDNAKRRAD